MSTIINFFFYSPDSRSRAILRNGDEKKYETIQATAIPMLISTQGIRGPSLTSTRLVFLNLRCNQVENM
jgi:hypothetical protein